MREHQWKAFFDAVRSKFGGLKQKQVDGLKFLVQQDQAHGLSLNQLAYVLATVWHETAATMQPIEEYGKGRGRTYGRRDPETGQTYYGRGYVQLTWRANYRKADRAFGTRMEYDASIALRPEIAAKVLFRGMMEGWFTSHKLPDHVNGKTDFRNARKVVNGLDKATLIAGYARAFLTALEAAEHRPVSPPSPPDVPKPPEPVDRREEHSPWPALIMALIAGAIAGFVYFWRNGMKRMWDWFRNSRLAKWLWGQVKP